MSNLVEVIVPDIGNFDSVDIIEVFVKPGDTIAKEDSLITVESDKASMDIPSSHAGVVKEVKVKVGDKVSKDSLILLLEAEAGASAPAEAIVETKTEAPKAAAAPVAAAMPTPAAPQGDNDVTCEVVVLGSGPGGYTAAFRAADLGKKVVLTLLNFRWRLLKRRLYSI
jgi:dihydrolipoamide dehydrogenase